MVIATIMVVMATMLLRKTASRRRQVVMDLAAVIGTERAAMAADSKTRSSWARLSWPSCATNVPGNGSVPLNFLKSSTAAHQNETSWTVLYLIPDCSEGQLGRL